MERLDCLYSFPRAPNIFLIYGWIYSTTGHLFFFLRRFLCSILDFLIAPLTLPESYKPSNSVDRELLNSIRSQRLFTNSKDLSVCSFSEGLYIFMCVAPIIKHTKLAFWFFTNFSPRPCVSVSELAIRQSCTACVVALVSGASAATQAGKLWDESAWLALLSL